MNFLEELNKEQYGAVTNFEGPCLVLAGAGSGKTRVLTYRIAYMVSKGVAPRNIMSLTFTNKAAQEMKERIGKIVGDNDAKSIWMGTFHSIFAKILRIESEKIGFTSDFSIYQPSDCKTLIKDIVKSLQLNDKDYDAAKLLNRISKSKNSLMTPVEYRNSKDIFDTDKYMKMPLAGEVYSHYFARCKKSNVMDFDDLLLYTNILFRDHPDILQKYSQMFRYILVDEYQDTNFAQYLIVKKLAQRNQNLCVVGDDAQSIYSFRGAKIENILKFQNDYPNFKTFKLERNYRSTQTIVDAANSVIKYNKEQLKKNVFSENEKGEKIQLIETKGKEDEAFQVVYSIKTRLEATGAKYDDFAILYRTNAQSLPFEEAFVKYNIPYVIYKGLSFYERKEIKDFLAYICFIVNPLDDISLRRIINVPKRNIGETTVEKVMLFARNNEMTMWETIQNIENIPIDLNNGAKNNLRSFVNLIEKIKEETASINAFEAVVKIDSLVKLSLYVEEDEEKGPARIENINEFISSIEEYVNKYEGEEQPTIKQYLSDASLLIDSQSSNEEEDNKVRLMTVHAAKGLEFRNVYIVGLEEGTFPSGRAMYSESELEEERRLFYVALTRAKEYACMSFAKERFSWGSEDISRKPSRFIEEIDSQYVKMPFNYSFDRAEDNEPSISNNDRRYTPSNKPTISFQRPSTPKPELNFKLKKLSEISEKSAKSLTDYSTLKVEDKVIHQIFGKGIVQEIEGKGSDMKATILFQSGQTKKILLKFTNLKIVE